MTRRSLHLAAALALALAACGSADKSPGTSNASLTVTASASSVLADGTSSVVISVDGSTKGPIQVRTNRGFFAGGANTFSANATPFTVTLYSCDASVTASCAGTAIVQSVDGSLAVGAVTITFMAVGGTGGNPDAGTDAGTGGGTDAGTGGGGTGVSTLAVGASSTRIPADGLAKATVTATLAIGGSPAAGQTVTFAISGVGSLGATTAVTDALGVASVTVTSDKNGGSATVTATDKSSGATGSVSIAMPQLGQVNLLSQKYQVQGVRFSGYQETNQLTFQLLDTAGLPYPAGLAVSFSHQSQAGSYIGAVSNCSKAVPSTCSASGSTDSLGQATVAFTSGRIAGVASVGASATAGNLSASGAANNLAVVGAKSSGAHITVDCSPKNVPVLSDDDCSFSHYVGPGNIISCSASFADRFNNALGISTLATFASEAGSAGPPTSTPQYDSTKPPSSQTTLGIASDFINVSGGKLPADVAPFGGEFSFQYKDACGNLVHNPRDGLVTVIVMANGEEGFVDLNGNGQYDLGEPFIDMGEPYIDENDNGKWDPGEYFVDLNGNGQYDGPNGVWDANTVIWAETRVLFTGFPEVGSAGGKDDFSRFYTAGSPPTPTATSTFSLVGTAGPATSQAFGVVFMDGNFNEIASTASYGIGTSGNGVVAPKFSSTPIPIDDLGMSFTQQYCDKPTSPTQCSNKCQSWNASGACYVVTNVGACDLATRGTCTGFPYGSWSQAVVTGACKANSPDTVQATSTVNGVPTTISLAGTCSACSGSEALCSNACVDTTSDPKNCGGCGVTCSGSQTCQFGSCQGSGGGASPIAVAVASSSARIAADGKATAVITATVTSNGVPAPGRAVSFAQAGSGATLGGAILLTSSNGQATATLTSDANGGTATVTVTDTVSSQAGSVAVVMPQLGQVNLLSQQYSVQGVRFSGFQETNRITFQLLDTAGQPYPAGLAVAFSHQSLGGTSTVAYGSYLGSVATCTNAHPSVCTASGTTDASGQVSVLLTSGQLAGVASVNASAIGGKLGASGNANNIAIVGAKSSGAHITLDCSPKNIPALTVSDCNFSHYAGPGNIVTCNASFADRFNNVLGIPTQVTFASEAGSAGPPASTPQYDSTKPPTGQSNLGIATDFINVTGAKLPIDVTPFGGEFSYSYKDACGTLVHNPRDGLVTVIVMANGEEGFVDANGNGQYDPGEPFIDMGEPYIDANDNGKWDPGEPFVDLNNNGVYDGPNGVWDSNTVIWAETRLLYTGFPAVARVGGSDDFSRFLDNVLGSPPAPTPFPTFSVVGSSGSTSQLFRVDFMDGNFNEITPKASYAIATLGSGVVSTKYTDIPGSVVDSLGMSFTQQYCDKQTAPSKCSNVCQAWNASGACYVVTNVGECDLSTSPPSACSGFSSGSMGQAQVTGTCGTVPAFDTVRATATVNSVDTSIDLTGTCTCAAWQQACFGACVNIKTDPNNCGGCGIACNSTQVCSTGTCQ
jgi:Bacterial Ig-like domain (group 1)/Stigma-specific protein, Stig1